MPADTKFSFTPLREELEVKAKLGFNGLKLL